ncbi:MAG TPA: HD domain-containing phosphohydrolase [Anaerolineae bacterium]|nr:HD domain-containing phosphohydrolase [Anaerolineae bacterium]
MTHPTPAQPARSRLRLAEIVAALSLATDLGTGHPLERSLRACLLGVHFGAALGLDDRVLREVYYVALLRWVGCTADSQRAELFGDEIALGPQIDSVELWNPAEMLDFLRRTVGQGEPPEQRQRKLNDVLATGIQRSQHAAVAHCEVAQNIAARLSLGEALLQALGQLFERWDGRGVPGQAKGETLNLAVRIMHIAMDAELFYRLGGSEAAAAVVRQRAGGFYDPTLADRFCREAPRLFRLLEGASTWEAVLTAEPGEQQWLSEAQLDDALQAIADFTDLRSPARLGHSRGVAELVEAAARRLGLSADEVRVARQAGLVHDVGMVALPLLLCEKPGPLTESEWERVRLHPYYTERILARPRALAGIGVVASLHHERLDGSGYHRGLPVTLLPPVARVLAAANLYRALIEPRAHRGALAPEAAAAELRREVQAGRLDGEAVSAVLEAAGHPVNRARSKQVAGLTDREIEVLRLVARSCTNKQIAQQLTLSEHTVDHHIRHIYTKIGVSTRAAATLFALQNHLVGE